MEPRASTPQRRLDAIRALNAAGIPAGVMTAPLIRQMRGGALYQSSFGVRMKGEGPIAELLGARFAAAVKRLELNRVRYRLDVERFRVPESARTALVDASRDGRQLKLL